ADLIARITSHTSGPPARAARRPVGPSRNTTPGCSIVRNPSSTSRLTAADRERPGWEAANELRRRATSGSNLTGIGDLRAINYSVVDGACSVHGERILVAARSSYPWSGVALPMTARQPVGRCWPAKEGRTVAG